MISVQIKTQSRFFESNQSSGLKNVYEKLRFRDGLVWMIGLTVEIKLRFGAGLVWMVGLTVEIKLRFQIPPA